MDFDLAASMHVLDSFLKVSASYPLLLQRAARRPLMCSSGRYPWEKVSKTVHKPTEKRGVVLKLL